MVAGKSVEWNNGLSGIGISGGEERSAQVDNAQRVFNELRLIEQDLQYILSLPPYYSWPLSQIHSGLAFIDHLY